MAHMHCRIRPVWGEQRVYPHSGGATSLHQCDIVAPSYTHCYQADRLKYEVGVYEFVIRQRCAALLAGTHSGTTDRMHPSGCPSGCSRLSAGRRLSARHTFAIV